MDFRSAQKVLISTGVQIDDGLSDAEFRAIEDKYLFHFPPDLREFLSIGLPVSHEWIDWRRADKAVIQERFDWPFRGMCFDIEHNAFWLEEWGVKPTQLDAAIDVARRGFVQFPKLIPIYSHRYIPDLPHEVGNPIFSVYQTDIIYYGADLLDYIQNEYRSHFQRAGHQISRSPKQILFWSMMAES